MKIINSAIRRHASPSEVWNVITNFVEFPRWDPFIRSISGNVIVNNKIKVMVKPVGSSEMTFNPTVLTYLENKEISWEGNLFIKGIFDGKHILKLIDNKTLKGFYLMNQKLKEILENKDPHTFSIQG